MAKRLLRSIAVSLGAGLAGGWGRTLKSRPSSRPAPNLDPILTRIEKIEGRVLRVELAPSPPATPSPEEIAALGTLVSSQSEDIAFLRQELLGIERRSAQHVEAFGQKVALLEQQVPAQIEASIAARMTELEGRLRGEFQEVHHRTVDRFAETIEQRVVARITAMENSLIEQSQSIVSLREKSVKTDDNLQRLLDAVEKLCARAEVQSHIQAPQVQPQQVQAPLPDRRSLERETEREAELELELAFAGGGSSSAQRERHSTPPLRLGLRPVGVALLGLAILGFRYIR